VRAGNDNDDKLIKFNDLQTVNLQPLSCTKVTNTAYGITPTNTIDNDDVEYGIKDSGATSHFVPMRYKGEKKILTEDGTRVWVEKRINFPSIPTG
jgi:hypothetical protein